MNNIALCVGWSVIIAVSGLVMWLVIEMLVAVVAVASWLRWALTRKRMGTTHLNWWALPKTMFFLWVDLTGHRNTGSSTWTAPDGQWRGIGDWSVWSTANYKQENDRG